MVCSHTPLCLHHFILLCQLSKESHMHLELALLGLSQAFLLLLQQNVKLDLQLARLWYLWDKPLKSLLQKCIYTCWLPAILFSQQVVKKAESCTVQVPGRESQKQEFLWKAHVSVFWSVTWWSGKKNTCRASKCTFPCLLRGNLCKDYTGFLEHLP